MSTSFKKEGYRTKEIQIRPMGISDVIQAIRVANQAFVEGARFTSRTCDLKAPEFIRGDEKSLTEGHFVLDKSGFFLLYFGI